MIEGIGEFVAMFCHRGPSCLLGAGALPVCARCAGFYPALAGMGFAAVLTRRRIDRPVCAFVVGMIFVGPMVLEAAMAHWGLAAMSTLLQFMGGALAGVGVGMAGWAVLVRPHTGLPFRWKEPGGIDIFVCAALACAFTLMFPPIGLVFVAAGQVMFLVIINAAVLRAFVPTGHGRVVFVVVSLLAAGQVLLFAYLEGFGLL